jgi:site-specific DNA-cytosine methylase
MTLLPGEIVVDSFAGGGGASLGIQRALGRSPDIAINHDVEAMLLHAANHPDSRYYRENVWQVDPLKACNGRPVGLMWLSPDCKHFSKAKGGKPVSKKIRGLAWVAVRWARAVAPRIIVLENVEEFQTWGPVRADGRPCPERKGKTFRAFVRKLERLGYAVEWRELRACDYGAPTIRKRLFIIARRDGQPIKWPIPTHGKGRPLPWRTAAECIDWSIPCPSIFLSNAEARALRMRADADDRADAERRVVSRRVPREALRRTRDPRYSATPADLDADHAGPSPPRDVALSGIRASGAKVSGAEHRWTIHCHDPDGESLRRGARLPDGVLRHAATARSTQPAADHRLEGSFRARDRARRRVRDRRHRGSSCTARCSPTASSCFCRKRRRRS